ncbi:MAG: ribose-5-phosphate isomerase RpiA [Candidatus Micrarchaeia archaeon]
MEEAKERAAREAAKLVKKGMALGLGTGSTAARFIEAVAARERAEGLGLRCVATSLRSEELARRLGLRVLTLEEVEGIDLAVDGADQIDPRLNLLKGLGGGAVTREKVVDYLAKKFVVIADESKAVKRLDGVVAVEVIRFAAGAVARALKRMGASVNYRLNERGERFTTDNGNFMLDARFGVIKNPAKLERDINAIPGVVENGIFAGRASLAIIGSEKGVRALKR